MEVLGRLPIVRWLKARGVLLPALVLVTVAAVLLQGALYREPPSDTSVDPAVAQAAPPPAPSFRPDLEKTPLSYESDFWRQLGDSTSENLVLIGSHRSPGIVVTPGFAVTSISAATDVWRLERRRRAEAEQLALLQGRTGADPAGEEVAPAGQVALPDAPRLMGVDVDRGLALFALPGHPAPGLMMANPATLHAGVFVAAVSLARDGSLRVTPGHLVSAAVRPGESLDVAIAFPSATVAAAIVDLDGDLVGLAVEAEGGMRLISARAATEVVAQLHGGTRCDAIDVADVDETVARLLRIEGGVVIERVVAGAFSRPDPLQAGDVLLTWNGQMVRGATEFAEAYAEPEAGSVVRYEVVRGRRRVAGELRMPRADCRPVPEAPVHLATLGVTIDWSPHPDSGPAGGWEVLVVRNDSPAADAGLEPGDVIVSVDGRALTETDAPDRFERFERRKQAMLLTVRRDTRVTLIAVAPGP